MLLRNEVGVSKTKDDKHARQIFQKKAMKEKEFLLKELDLIKPSCVVALGNESYFLLQEIIGIDYKLTKIRHPSQGGSKIARDQLRSLCNSSINLIS